KELSGQFSTNSFGTGPSNRTLAGFPHFRNVEFVGEFPIAKLTFTDDDFPGTVILTAFNPLIPLNEDDSSIPAAFFEIEVLNNTDNDIEYQVAFTSANPFSLGKNEYVTINGKHYIKMTNAEADVNSPEYGDITISTDCEDVVYQTYWYRGRWQDNIVTFWNEFSVVSDLSDRKYDEAGKGDHGTLCAKLNTAATTTEKVRFILSWNIPNMHCYWVHHGEKDRDGKAKVETWKNYYAILFENSFRSAEYSLNNWNRLYEDTLIFKDTLHTSTLEPVVIEAASSNLSVLKSPTVFRLEDGTFYGWEGVYQDHGSCEGTCEHVWNYAYALCFLFPNLERSIRNAEFKYATDEQGLMSFRMALPVGTPCYEKRPCVDGQMGSVIKSYREWKISGDDAWLKEKWPTIKKVLEYAWNPKNPFKWDLDKDGILEGRQHHTLDMELFGPSSWLQSMYLLALKVGAEMAEFVGEPDTAKEYLALYENGIKFMKEELFNGEYFIHKIDITDKTLSDRFEVSNIYWNDEKKQLKYQIANGTEIDQMLGQWHSFILGCGYLFDKEQMNTALDSMMKYNFIPSMRNFANPWRIFCLNDEAGAVMCAYPDHIGKPAIPVPYCEENMTGFEYSFAGLLFAAGKIEDGLKVVKAVRDRYDGEKRNPWNEIECGSNYARTMASFSFLPIFSGFEFDLSRGHIGFAPIEDREYFKFLFSLGTGWGYFEKTASSATVKLNGGKLHLKTLGAKFTDSVSKVTIDGRDVEFTFENGIIAFNEQEINESIEIKL
ncbi:MAG: hypothetical protein IJW27_01375, partial [Clostridia bacterium]|nr:hypothetical protein [Clostridia bacterium]